MIQKTSTSSTASYIAANPTQKCLTNFTKYRKTKKRIMKNEQDDAAAIACCVNIYRIRYMRLHDNDQDQHTIR